MASWYDVGTVSVTNGSATVTGSGTDFLTGTRVGDGFLAPDGNLYEISAIGGATSLTLGQNYNGSTTSGAAYSVVPTQALTGTLADNVATLISDYQSGLDSISSGVFKAADGTVSAPGVTFANDLNTGLYSIADNNLGVAVSGVKVLDLVSTGVNANLRFLDNKKATFGASDDLQIYHDGTDSKIIDNGTGNLILGGSGIIYLTNPSVSEIYASFHENGQATLRYDNAQKLATTSAGVAVTGELDVNSSLGTEIAWDATDSTTIYTSATFGGRLASNLTLASDDSRNQYIWSQYIATDLTLGARRSISGSNRNVPAVVIEGATGDVKFMEDTGTTAKFLWDASAEALGIGTSSPSFGSGSGVEIEKAGAATLRLQNTAATNAVEISATSSAVSIYGYNNYPLAFATNSAEAMRIDSSGNVLVGTTATSLYDDATGSGAMISSDGRLDLSRSNNLINLNRTGTTVGSMIQLRTDGAVKGEIGVYAGSFNYPYINSQGLAQDSGFVFTSGAVLPYGDTIAADVIDLGSTNNRFKNLHLSGGVYLGGTGAANYLDDYEEGTFTPVIEGITTAGTGTYTTQVGKYVKIGNLVHCIIYINVDAHTGTGNMLINGLPFTSVTQAGVTIGDTTSLTKPADSVVMASTYYTTAKIRLFTVSTTSTAQNMTELAMDTDFSIALSVTYNIT